MKSQNTRESKELKKERKRPSNVRQMLNKAADVANDMVQVLEPIAKAGLLDREQRENFRLAVDVLKNCRELYLKQQALRSVQRDMLPPANPLEGVKDDGELRKLAAQVIDAEVIKPKK